MIKLYYAPGACSLAAHILLEELEKPYEAIKVDLKTHKVGSEDYYKINPQGAVPALMLEDGNVLTQNGAILSYLGDLDPKHQLIPKAGTMERVRCHEWLSFLGADVHKLFGPLFGPDRFVTSATAKEELKQHVEDMVKNKMGFIDKKLSTKNYALGEHFSVVDPYLLVFYRWANYFKLPVAEWPHYSALTQRILARPAVQRVMAAEGLTQ
jgi:glutathione S-transferase